MTAGPRSGSLFVVVRRNPFLACVGLILLLSLVAGPLWAHGARPDRYPPPRAASDSLHDFGDVGSWSPFPKDGHSADGKSGRERYFIRDWPLYLGWNNMRYNLESAHLQARILGRTLVIPSFVYLRSCQSDPSSCSLFAEVVDRREALNWHAWADESATVYKVPLRTMVNVTHLTQSSGVPIITTSELYARLGLPASLERADGFSVLGAGYYSELDPNRVEPDDARRTREEGARLLRSKASVHIIPNEEYDTKPDSGKLPRIIRMDRLPPSKGKKQHGGGHPHLPPGAHGWEASEDEARALTQRLIAVRQSDGHVSDGDAMQIMGVQHGDPKELERRLAEIGWIMRFTFRAPDGANMAKAVARVEDQVVELVEARGWWDDYHAIEDDILFVAGEIHDIRAPAFMGFSSTAARSEFRRKAIHHVRPNDCVIEAAEQIVRSLRERCGGRVYLGAHMRRGDFTSPILGWAPKSFEEHLNGVKNRLRDARRLLRDRAAEFGLTASDLPQDSDPFFIATDEEDPAHLDLIRAAGGVLSKDFISLELQRTLGWPGLFGDVWSEVEQVVLARGGFFSASLRSSIPGWIINQRAALGFHSDTSELYYP